MKKFFLFILCLFIADASLSPRSDAKVEISTQITICQFEIPDAIKNANTSFYVTYSMETGDEGKPEKIRKIKDDFVGQETVAACVANWSFMGVPKNTPIVVSYRWQHGFGWKSLSISSKNFVQVINLEANKPS